MNAGVLVATQYIVTEFAARENDPVGVIPKRAMMGPALIRSFPDPQVRLF
jgi:hypothetical protein